MSFLIYLREFGSGSTPTSINQIFIDCIFSLSSQLIQSKIGESTYLHLCYLQLIQILKQSKQFHWGNILVQQKQQNTLLSVPELHTLGCSHKWNRAEPESQDKLEALNNLAGPLDLATDEQFLKRIQNVALLKQQIQENKINYDKLM
ncbi:Hypothetical_protein [Hexamita inflata]|uniref:Hypothetical_protein n=1 Tax=Hexamita inflata TaxID=28002 RepID=A0AA86P3S0_9EUKA|nr:Hypothetical protein HINF_LOCUS18748 [Hexamita inflata]